MRYTKLLLLVVLITFVTCSKRREKNEEALVQSIGNATHLLEEKNQAHFEKLEKRYKQDTANAELKMLYTKFSLIRQYKEEYISAITSAGTSEMEKANKKFVEKCFAQLDAKERGALSKTFSESLMMHPDLLRETELTKALPLELKLEAELMVRDMQLQLLKDLNAKKPEFDWKYYWE